MGRLDYQECHFRGGVGMNTSFVCEICGKFMVNDASSIIFTIGYGPGKKCVMCSTCNSKVKKYIENLKKEEANERFRI